MGFEYIKRPLRVLGSTSIVAGSVSADGLVTSGDFTVPVQSLTGTDVDQSLSDDGVTFITIATSNLKNSFVLPKPPRAGAVKYVFVNFNTTSGDELDLHSGGTAAGSSEFTFWGTTYNTITGTAIAAGGGDNTGGTNGLLLVGQSTDQWACTVIGSTVVFNLVASTGSTSQN